MLNKKGFFTKINLQKKEDWKKVYNKNLTIIPEYINEIFSIYNGNKFIQLKILNKMVGYKFGEFIYTRKKNIYKKNGSKNNTNKFKIK